MANEQVTIVIQLTGQEEVAVDYHPAGSGAQRTLEHGGFNIGPLNFLPNNTVIKTTAIIPMEITIGPSAEVIDLTAAEKALARTADLTDAKLFALLVRAHEGNAGDVVIKGGDASDAAPYLLFGTSGQLTLGPGEVFAKTSRSQFNLPAVASGSRYIKISGTENDQVDFLAYFGETPA